MGDMNIFIMKILCTDLENPLNMCNSKVDIADNGIFSTNHVHFLQIVGISFYAL